MYVGLGEHFVPAWAFYVRNPLVCHNNNNVQRFVFENLCFLSHESRCTYKYGTQNFKWTGSVIKPSSAASDYNWIL